MKRLRITSLVLALFAIAPSIAFAGSNDADLSVMLRSFRSSVKQGQRVTMVSYVTNEGPGVAQDAALKFEVPAGLTYIPRGRQCSQTDSVVSCAIGRMSKRSRRAVVIQFDTASASCSQDIPFSVTVTSSNDPNSDNNVSDTVHTTVTCPNADLSISKSGPKSVEHGSDFVYTLTVKNDGPLYAKNVVVTDVLPDSLSFVSARGCTANGQTVTCNLGYVTRSRTKTVDIKVSTSGAACNASVSNTASVDSATLDLNTENNTSETVSTLVTCPVSTTTKLAIAQKAQVTSDVTVKNQKDINLLRFEAKAFSDAGSPEDILFTGLTLEAAAGDLTNATNYVLWVDTDDNGVVDTVVQKNVSAAGGLVLFQGLEGSGYPIPVGTEIVFEVHADVTSPIADDNTLKLAFATSNSNYITAQTESVPLSGIETDGSCAATCSIIVHTNDATLWTIKSQGDLYVTKSTTPVRPRQLLGGTLADEVLRLKFRAENEDVDVTSIVFTAIDEDAFRIGANVERLELYRVGEVTPFAFATTNGCSSVSVTLANSLCVVMYSQELIIPKNSSVNVSVRPKMRTDTDGAVSGDNVRLLINRDGGTSSSTGSTITARGVTSSSHLEFNNNNTIPEGEVFVGTDTPDINQDITGNANTVVLSKIVSILNANPDANGTMIPTLDYGIGQFKFSAAVSSNLKNSPNKVVLDDLMFTVSALNVEMNTGAYKVYNKATPWEVVFCSLDAASTPSVQLVRCPNLAASSVDTEIASGDSMTMVLSANVLSPKINPALVSSLRVSLTNFAENANTAVGASESHIGWIDSDFGAQTEFFWIEYPETTVHSTSYAD